MTYLGAKRFVFRYRLLKHAGSPSYESFDVHSIRNLFTKTGSLSVDMGIEGQDPEWGRLIPICCAANIPSNIRDRFLARSIDYWNHPSPCWMVFVDDLSKTYTEQSAIEEGPALSQAPFKDKSPEECYQLLRFLRFETSSDISCPSFIIIDERSLRDDTVLLVGESLEQEGQLEHVRADVELAYKRLNIYEMLYPGDGIKEDQVAAQATVDGVLRAEAIELRKHRQK